MRSIFGAFSFAVAAGFYTSLEKSCFSFADLYLPVIRLNSCCSQNVKKDLKAIQSVVTMMKGLNLLKKFTIIEHNCNHITMLSFALLDGQDNLILFC